MCRLPPSKPRLAAPTVSAAMTAWESIDHALSNSLRSCATRNRSRSRCGRPRAFHCAKNAYTACHGGKSAGSARHSTYLVR